MLETIVYTNVFLPHENLVYLINFIKEDNETAVQLTIHSLKRLMYGSQKHLKNLGKVSGGAKSSLALFKNPTSFLILAKIIICTSLQTFDD